ncbi:MAG: 50S ribosomal protein L31e [Candidatus Pacearchaeota archaeon]
MEERIYTINLFKGWKKVPYWKRAKKSVNVIRNFIVRNMHASVNNIKLDTWLNAELWKKSSSNPPRRIRVKATKDEKGIVKVELFEKPKKLLKLERKKAKKAEKERKVKEKKEEEKEEKKTKEEKKEGE